jgi:hypothetical protein
MAESVTQGMHHMAHQSTLSETNEDLFHDAHLELQERMQNPIAFHAEMMGDILKLQQAIKDIQDIGLNIEDQGHPADYIGVNIKKL